MMMTTPAAFRTAYPEFANTAVYSDELITYWLQVAQLALNCGTLYGVWTDSPCVTGQPSWLDLGTGLYVAHYLSLEAYAIQQAATGQQPTGPSGIINSRAVGPASIGYDTVSSVEEGAGQWNLTLYGRRFYQLCQIRGGMPLQIGIGCPPPYSMASTGAWAGPWPWPSQTGFSS